MGGGRAHLPEAGVAVSDDAVLAGDVAALAIGASAGGVEAISTLLQALPSRLGAAVLVVLHLPRDRQSLLPGLFQAKCALPVREAEDKEPVLPGRVYVAPPDYHLLVDAGPSLSLSVDPPVNWSRPSIDVLFESAADVYGQRLVGVVLTGANDDGAGGAAKIAAAGGRVLVQAPEGALSPTMPEAALRRVPSARPMTLAQMAALIGTLDASPADGPSSPPDLSALPR